MSDINKLTQKGLREILHYIPETGYFIWKVRPAYRLDVGSIAGTVIKTGLSRKKYRSIIIKGKGYLSHRLVWLYVYGEFPKKQIDHIDGNGLNNSLENLREVSASTNCKNVRLRRNNKTGQVGVLWNKANNKWVAQILLKGKNTQLYYGDDFFEAVCARKSAEFINGYHKLHGALR